MRITFYMVACIEVMLHQLCFAQEKIQWRIYDQDFNNLTEIRTTDISILNELIWYKANGKYGVMDMRNNILIKPKYETIHHHKGGFTSVGIKNCFGMVHHGSEILPLEYSNQFSADTSGYFIAKRGCSEDIEAYIISEHSIHDVNGTVISQSCEKDIEELFANLTGLYKNRRYDAKTVSNGFSIKLLSSDRYIKKGIYNRNDSLVFSCSNCIISDNIYGEFVITQRQLNKAVGFESYTIDTVGAIKIKDNFDRLYYFKNYNRYLYERGNEKGRVNIHGDSKILTKTNASIGIQVISKNRFLISVSDSANVPMSTICDSLGTYLFAPTKYWFQVVSSNCLIHKIRDGYIFTDANGNSVSDIYDSVFSLPDFDYTKMVLGDNRPRIVAGSDLHMNSPLDRDGFLPMVMIPSSSFYGIVRGGKKGLFNVENYTEVSPQYSIVATVNKKLFVAKKDNQWLIINSNGDVKSYGKCRYINFHENNVLIGN